MADTVQSPRSAWRAVTGEIPFLVVALLMAFLVRVWGLHAQGFTTDEMTELTMTRLGTWATVTAGDGFPPLYNLLLHGWLTTTGTPEAARWLSLVFGVLTVPVVYQLGRLIAGEGVGRSAALLLGISPLHVWYSQEVRAYALYICLAAVTLWRFVVARRSDRQVDWAWYVAAACAGLYTHYYFGFLVVALLAAETAQPGSPGSRRRAVIAHLTLAVLALPLLFLLGADLRVQMNWPDRGRPLGFAGLAYTIFTFVAGYSIGPSLGELASLTPVGAIRAALPWTLAAWVVTLYVLVAGLVGGVSRAVWRQLVLLVAVPIALCGVLGYGLDVGYQARYVAWCIVPFTLLMAIGFSAQTSRIWRLLALFVLIGTSATAIANRRLDARYSNRDSVVVPPATAP